jgi:hypothetical protein
MPSAGFEATIVSDERPQNYALDRVATGIGMFFVQTVLKLLQYSYLCAVV